MKNRARRKQLETTTKLTCSCCSRSWDAATVGAMCPHCAAEFNPEPVEEPTNTRTLAELLGYAPSNRLPYVGRSPWLTTALIDAAVQQVQPLKVEAANEGGALTFKVRF